MNIIDVENWEEFEFKLKEIISTHGGISQNSLIEETRILYRGQADSKWKLINSLERYTTEEYSVDSYLDITLNCEKQIESFTDRKFNLTERKLIVEDINNKSDLFHLHLPVYEYWVYLRHHGFPSPFLDWTFSPYIATFFAFAEQNIAEKCSVYIYMERPEGVKVNWGTSPRICVFGPNTKAHKRHFLQQSWYSIALKAARSLPDIREYSIHKFISHEEIFNSSKENQDLIFQITIPRVERLKILKYLNRFNINHFSLIQSEESLMQTLAFKEIYE